jgi:Cdc6-like AAA superfamily ATPase
MAINEMITTVLISGTAAAVLTRTIDWLRGRKGDNVDAAADLADSALKLVAAAREDARQAIELLRMDVNSARMEAAEARNEAAAARNEATQARREAMYAVATLRQRDLAILSPYATLESLRELVSQGPNGFGGASVHQT